MASAGRTRATIMSRRDGPHAKSGMAYVFRMGGWHFKNWFRGKTQGKQVGPVFIRSDQDWPRILNI